MIEVRFRHQSSSKGTAGCWVERSKACESKTFNLPWSLFPMGPCNFRATSSVLLVEINAISGLPRLQCVASSFQRLLANQNPQRKLLHRLSLNQPIVQLF